MLSITEGPTRLRAVVAAVGELPREVRAELRKQTREQVLPLMEAAARRHAGGDQLAQRLAARPRASFWRDVPGVAFGGAGSITRDGTPGRVLAHAVELGSQGSRVQTVETRSPRGKRYTVRKRTTVQFRPERPAGRFVTPAAESIADDVTQLWADLVDQQVLDAFGEG